MRSGAKAGGGSEFAQPTQGTGYGTSIRGGGLSCLEAGSGHSALALALPVVESQTHGVHPSLLKINPCNAERGRFVVGWTDRGGSSACRPGVQIHVIRDSALECTGRFLCLAAAVPTLFRPFWPRSRPARAHSLR